MYPLKKKIYHVFALEESILSKVTILPKKNYRFKPIFIKLSGHFFTELEQKNLKICMKKQLSMKKEILQVIL